MFRLGSRLLIAVLLGCCLFALGCEKPSGNLQGVVKYREKPAQNAVLVVKPIGEPNRTTEVAADGSFSMANLPIGKAEVAVMQFNPNGDAAPPPWVKDPLPTNYGSTMTSGLSVDIKPGDNTQDFSL